MKVFLSLVYIFLALTTTKQQSDSGPGRLRFGDSEFLGMLAGFTKSPAEGVIVEVERPIVVRKVSGVLRSAGGEWPETTEILFEIRGPSPAKTLKGVLADRKGKFSLGRVSPGSYLFKATAIGWQSVIGILVVSPSAKENQIELTMPLGV